MNPAAGKTPATTLPVQTGPATPSASEALTFPAAMNRSAKSPSTATGAPRSAPAAQPASPLPAQLGIPSILQNSTSTPLRRLTAPTTSSSSPQISPAPAAARPASWATTSFTPTRRGPDFARAPPDPQSIGPTAQI